MTKSRRTSDLVNSILVNPDNSVNIHEGTESPYFLLTTGATPTPEQGMLFWDADRQTAGLQMNGVEARLGQDNFWYVKNQSGSDILKGTAVMAVGALGASSRILIAPMVADGSVDAIYLLGITAEDILNGEDGFVMNIGKIRGIDTTQYGTQAGQVLYCDPATPGGFTITQPDAPNLDIPIAFTVDYKSNGTIAVRVNPGYKIGELHDVYSNSPSNNDILLYNSTNSRWENTPLSSAVPTPTLQSVTDAGNTSSNPIVIGASSLPSTGLDTKLYIEGSGGGASGRTGFLVKNTNASSAAIFRLLNSNDDFIIFQISGPSYAIPSEATVAVKNTVDLGFTAGGNVASGATNNIGFRTGGYAQDYAMTILGNKNVLIGTTTDAGYKLDVNGTLAAQLTNATQTDQVYYDSTTGELTYGALPVVTTPTLDEVTTAGNTTTNSITTGDLTVNTTGLTDIRTSLTYRFVLSNSNNPTPTYGPDGLGISGGNYGELIYATRTLSFAIIPSTTTSIYDGSGAATFLKSGNYGSTEVPNSLTIGTTQPFGTRFYVQGNTNVVGGSSFWVARFNSNSSTQRFGISNDGYTAINTDALVSHANKNITIGTITDAGYKLDVNGITRTQGLLSLGTGTNSTAIGLNAISSASSSIAIGTNSESGGDNCVAIGNGSRTIWFNSIAIGLNSAANITAVGIGGGVTALNRSVAVGDTSYANKDSVAIGNIATTNTGEFAVAIGQDAQVFADYGVALGQDTRVNQIEGIAIGADAASSNGGIAIGRFSVASLSNAVAIGRSVTALYADGTTVNNFAIANYALLDFPDDIAAGGAGVPLGGVYHTGGTLKIRIT
jgi:hypothetical protein